MKTLTIRQVMDAAHDNLRVAAASAGKSMEDFVRDMIHRRFLPAKKPDFTRLHELQDRIAAQRGPTGLDAAQAVREMRDEDNDLVDAKWRRVEADWAKARAERGDDRS